MKNLIRIVGMRQVPNSESEVDIFIVTYIRNASRRSKNEVFKQQQFRFPNLTQALLFVEDYARVDVSRKWQYYTAERDAGSNWGPLAWGIKIGASALETSEFTTPISLPEVAQNIPIQGGIQLSFGEEFLTGRFIACASLEASTERLNAYFL